MAELVSDCPRCGANKITFTLLSSLLLGTAPSSGQLVAEAFCVCRNCNKSTVFVLVDRNKGVQQIIRNYGTLEGYSGGVNEFIIIERYVRLRDKLPIPPPEHTPENINAVFNEGATCLAVNCFNAAGTMFRLCVDIATKNLLPPDDVDGINSKIRRSLGLRMNWLFDKGRLPEALRELSICIKEDGNDGAHDGTLNKEDSEDLLDFTEALLERIYTEPKRLEIAKQRREERRNQSE